jgi:hypothetical protein
MPACSLGRLCRGHYQRVPVPAAGQNREAVVSIGFGALTASREASRFNSVTGMSVQRIQVGQVWRKLDSDETFLVTRLYSEALATFAILRPTGSENSAMLRIKIERTGAGQTLPGFSMAHSLE